MSYLKNINRFSGSGNMGGILQLWVARKADVVSIPEPKFGLIVGEIVFASGKGFVVWNVTVGKSRAKSQSKTSREGTIRNNGLNFLIPKDRLIVKPMLDLAETDEFIIFIKDSNGNNELFGNTDLPFKFEYDHDSGEEFAELNAYDCRFYYEGPDNVAFYSGSIAPQPLGDSPAIVKYSSGEIIATLNPSDILVVSSDFTHSFTHHPGSGPSGVPAVVKWDDESPIASLQPGDILIVETDFDFEFEIIGSL